MPVQVQHPEESGMSELFEPTSTLRRKHGIVAPDMLVDVAENPFNIRVYNPNAQPIQLHENTCRTVESLRGDKTCDVDAPSGGQHE